MGKITLALKSAALPIWQGLDWAAGGSGVILLAISHWQGKNDTPFESLAFIAVFAGLASACIRSHKLLAKLKPRLKVACSPDVPCCKVLSRDRDNCVYRVRIINEGREPIQQCKARLWRITRDTETVFEGDSPQLTFTPSGGEDALSKTLEYQVPHTLDVLFLYRDDPRTVVLATKIGNVELVWGHKPLNEIFDRKGEYRLHIKVSGEPLVYADLILLFDWKGDWFLSELWLENIGPKEARDPNP